MVLFAGGLVVALVAPGTDPASGWGKPRRDTGQMLVPDKIHSGWGRKLNPTGAVPNEGFRAFYINRDDPGRLIFQEDVDSIAIKYAWADFHNINSPQFAGYWVGRVRVPRTMSKQISVSLSWSKARIFVDGEPVFDGGGNKSFTHEFSKGDHIVEVEFANGWHTTEFKVTIEDPVETVPAASASDYIGDAESGARLAYVGLYESAAKDTSVTVNVPATGRPVVLWLTSYEAIDWTIVSADPVKVFVSAYTPGSRVQGRRVKRVVHVERAVSIYSETKRCSCSGGFYHCEGNQDLDNVAESLRSVTGMTLSGYAVKYSAAEVTVQPYGQSDRSGILDQRAAGDAAREQCQRKANPDFDKLME
ncbi:hypothetical protein [Sphingomonas immobilis]|uniref:PA14 domain-containing protein n=1 Tax=Sphingomonas immobilis TaxID=3063997 RepID=A0ABT8ZZC3_9SPHN|nr:hypothetical protein [Sphingomonas sp. CA1-15]MDO7842345.1 hypothetical protein [Sphingomonas sp. CA1-15]